MAEATHVSGMVWRAILICALTNVCFCAFPLNSFGAIDTVVKHRAIVNDKEPDLTGKLVAVMRSKIAPGQLAIRCHADKGLSVDVTFEQSIIKPAGMRMQYHADQGAVSEDKVWEAGRGKAIMPNGRQILEDALKASSLYVQLNGPRGPGPNMMFQPKNASATLERIQSRCTTDAPPPDQNGLAK